jgi:Secretion system C-terminal sorting domain
MKTKFLIALFSMCLYSVFSQQTGEPSIGQIKKEANDHFNKIKKEKGTLKGSGYADFKRWEWFWGNRLNDSSKISDATKERNTYINNRNLSRNTANLTLSSNYADCYNANTDNVWTAIGPSNFPNGNSAAGLGRMLFVRFSPNYGSNNNQTIFAGGNSGLWKSTNDGVSWTIAGTDQLDVSACSDLAINPSNPQVMYLATGLSDGGVHGYHGGAGENDDPYLKSAGLMKTTDGGISWQYKGPFPNQQTFTSLNEPIVYRMPKVLIHPQNTEIVYTIVYNQYWSPDYHWEGRIFKSIDGGNNWSKIYETLTGALLDMKFHPSNPNIFYVAGNRLYKFTDTQSNLSIITPTDLSNNLTGCDCSLQHNAFSMKIAVSIGAPNNVYIVGGGPNSLISNGTNTKYRYFWVSTNSGATFAQKLPIMPQCGYNCGMSDSYGLSGLSLSVSSDANTILFGRTALTKSIDGGNIFNQITNFDQLHPDKREIAYAPFSNNKLFLATDAGIYLSTDNGLNFVQRSNGLQIGWVTKLDIASTPNESSPDKTIVGLQDCTASYTNHQQDGWNQMGGTGGDNAWTAIDPNNPDIMYSEPQGEYNSIFKSIDGGISTSTLYTGGTEDGEWSTPFVLKPSNASKIILGKNNVWELDVNNSNSTKISNFNLPDIDNKILTLAASLSNPNCIVAAFRHGEPQFNPTGSSTFTWSKQLYKTMDGGTSWIDITPKSNPNSPKDPTIANGIVDAIASILIHPTNPDKIWITYSGYLASGYLKKVLFSDDGGANWINYSDGIPRMPINSIVMNNNRIADEELYIGTDVGIFWRNKYMKKWDCYGFNLPAVPVTDLKLNSNRKFIRAGLFGRGVWQSGTFCPYYPTYSLLGVNGSPESFYAANSSITSSSTINATEFVNGVVVLRNVAYRAPTINLIAGFEVKLGATFSTGVYGCSPYTANIVNNGQSESFLKKPLNDNAIVTTEKEIAITPNPFSNSVKLSLNLAERSSINLIIFDINGRIMTQIAEKTQIEQGYHEYKIDTSKWNDGMYFCKATINNDIKVYKFVKQF